MSCQESRAVFLAVPDTVRSSAASAIAGRITMDGEMYRFEETRNQLAESQGAGAASLGITRGTRVAPSLALMRGPV